MTWENGRQLATLQNGTNSVSYKYNTDGLRTQKTVNGVVTKYTLSGDQIIRQQTGSDAAIDYLYDASGSVIGMKYNGAYYYYVKDAQNNVARIVNVAGVQVTEYQYDAWGNMISATGTMASTVGAVNPFRYRSYYYDTETGLYYLQSRYYDPVVKRFINADSASIIGSEVNLFAYCTNNPVNFNDPTGLWKKVKGGWQVQNGDTCGVLLKSFTAMDRNG
ncbi:MAG: RHS repeat-associated core domain-containing protein [Oscillospiraceae bacterium]